MDTNCQQSARPFLHTARYLHGKQQWKNSLDSARFEVFTAVTMKNAVFLNDAPVRTDVSEESSASTIRVTRIGGLGITLA
jgi:hypothetical protein